MVGALAKCGRIKYHHIKLFLLLSERAQHFEHVAAQSVYVFKCVQVGIIPHIFKGERRDIACCYMFCRFCSVQRKSAAVAKTIQNFVGAAAVPAHGVSVLFLVEEIARLLSVFYINEHLYAVFANFYIVVNFAAEQSLCLGQSLFFSDGYIAPLVYPLGRKQLVKAIDYHALAHVDPQRKALDDEHFAVSVYYQRRQVVGFGKYHAVTVVVTELFAILVGGFYALEIKLFSIIFVVPDKYPYKYFRGVIYVAFAYISAVGGKYRCKRAVFIFVFYARHFVCIYPAMPGNYALFLIFFEINFITHVFILSNGENNCN